MTKDYFSLELGDNYIRLCDGNLDKGLFNISALSADYKPVIFFTNQTEKTLDEIAILIKNMVNSLRIKKKMVNIIIPDTYTYSQIMVMPRLKEKELISAIRYQADQFIPFPIEEATIDLDILYEDKVNKKLLILIVAASQNLIDVITRIIEKAGLIPTNIENEISAAAKIISSFYQYHNPNQRQPMIFINFGYFTTSLYFYNPTLNLITNLYNFKSGYNLFSREIQLNYNLDQIKSETALNSIGFAKGGSLDIASVIRPLANEFNTEIERFIYSVKEKEKISTINKLIIFNLADRINLFDQDIEKRLGIKTVKFDISSFIKKNFDLSKYLTNFSEFITVIGGNLE